LKNIEPEVIGLICITVIAIVAIVVLKADAKDILIGAVGGLVGWLGKGLAAKEPGTGG
jgi:hypothetical protein